MFNMDLQKYKVLNELAEQHGIVVFGGSEDMSVPLGELKQAFDIDSKMYNRSIAGISVKDAIEAYDACVASLSPETVLLHIGSTDLDSFRENPSDFDQNYRDLIAHIRTLNRDCRIAIVSLKNYDNDPTVSDLNTHLKYIADSERCDFGNIAGRRVWNPKGTMDAISFAQSMSFVRPMKYRRPVYDLVRMIFCYGA